MFEHGNPFLAKSANSKDENKTSFPTDDFFKEGGIIGKPRDGKSKNETLISPSFFKTDLLSEKAFC